MIPILQDSALNAFRITSDPRLASDWSDGNNGVFRIPLGGKRMALCVVSDGIGWDHVSVTIRYPTKIGKKKKGALWKNRLPTWSEMAQVKDLFFSPNEVVLQIHPRASDYVNLHETCLHLWRNQEGDPPLPPSFLVGPRENEPLAEAYEKGLKALGKHQEEQKKEGSFSDRPGEVWKLDKDGFVWLRMAKETPEKLRKAVLDTIRAMMDRARDEG